MDVASLRAEIKTWEREFRSQHARNPTIQEIKDQPAIASKYKLYKSLSKASSSAPITASSTARPATPPRSQPRQAASPSTSFIPKSRAVKVDPPKQTTNPFSPVKKQKTLLHDDTYAVIPPLKLSQRDSQLNPFTTPTKQRARSNPKPSAPRRTPSPDPFPPIQPALPAQPLVAPHTPGAYSAVTRARKRLRGEPVSPSPVKEKRVRIESQRALAFASTLLDSDDDVEDPSSRQGDADDTFMEATPMKPPPGGKSFRLLFDEVLPSPQDASRQPPNNRAFSRTKSITSKTSIFGKQRAKSRALSPSSGEDEDDNWQKGTKLKGLITPVNGLAVAKNAGTQQNRMSNGIAKRALPKAVVPGKDDLWSEVGPSRGPSNKSKASVTQGDNEISDYTSRSATKRPLPDEGPDLRSDSADGLANNGSSLLRLPLLPPSPPPAGSSYKPYANGAKDKGKGKAAATFSRKKARLLEQVGEGADDDSSDDENEEHIKIVEHPRYVRQSQLEQLDELDDSEFEWTSRPGHPSDPSDAVEPGTVDVRLPEDLKRILALSPKRDSAQDEEKLVKRLLYGRRETHYDAKGGEIWEVGEISEGAEGADGETEEDWEGEPIPWEVGEL